MKKIFSLVFVFLLAFVLVACKKDDPKPKETEQEIFDTMVVLTDISLNDSERTNIKNNFEVPTEVIKGEHKGQVAWATSNEEVAVYDAASATIKVTLPAPGEDDAVLNLIATISWTAPSGKKFTNDKEIRIRVKAMPDAPATTIAKLRESAAAAENAPHKADEIVKLVGVIVIHKASNGITVFDPETKHALFVFGTPIANAVEVGHKGDIVGAFGINFDSPQLKDAAFSKKDEVTLDDIKALATQKDVADFWITPYNKSDDADNKAGQAAELAGKIDPELNTLVSFNANVRDMKEWNNGNTSQYTTVLFDTNAANAEKYVRSYYGGMKHDEIKALDGKDNVLVFAVAYTIRNDRVKPATFNGESLEGLSVPTFEIFVIDYQAELTDADAVRLDKIALNVPLAHLENTTLTLPAVGNNGSTITWISSDDAVVNATTGEVTVTAGQTKNVTLTATLTKGTESDTRAFELVIGQAVVQTIASALAAEAGATVLVKGVVVDFILSVKFNTASVYIQDETGTILLHRVPGAQVAGLKVGEEFEVEGVIAVYQGLNQIDAFKDDIRFEKTDAAVVAVTPTVLDRALTEDDIYEIVTVEGYVKANGRTSTIVNGDVSYTLYSSSADDLSQPVYNAIQAKLVPGTKVKVTAIVGHYNKSPQLLLFRAKSIEVITGVAAELQALAVAAVEGVIPVANNNVTEDLSLPKTAPFGVTITWASSNTAVIANDGKVTRPEADTEVTLTFTAKLGETTLEITNNTVVFNVKASVGTDAVTAIAEYTGDSTTIMKPDENNAALIGLNAAIFTVSSTKNETANHVGLNKAGEIRLYSKKPSTEGNGTSLTIAIASGYTISSVEVVFGASTKDATASVTFGEVVHNLTAAQSKDNTHTYNDLAVAAFTIQNTHINTDNGQIFILSIKITYQAV